MFKLQLIPRDMHFFDLFEAAGENMVLAANRLIDLLENFEQVEAKAQAIKDIEHESDGITHEIINELRRTFIPPLDGDDIVALAEALDDVVDYIEDAAARIDDAQRGGDQNRHQALQRHRPAVLQIRPIRREHRPGEIGVELHILAQLGHGRSG